VTREVLPVVKDLRETRKPVDGELGAQWAAKLDWKWAAECREQYGGAGLDKISTTVLTEKFSIEGVNAGRRASTRASERCRSFILERKSQKKKYLPKLATGE